MTEKAGWEWKAWEQLGYVQGALISSGSLEERLTRIAGPRIAFILPEMVPEEHRAKVKEIRGRLGSGEPQAGEGAYAAAIAAMSEEERMQLAKDLLILCFECEMAWRED